VSGCLRGLRRVSRGPQTCACFSAAEAADGNVTLRCRCQPRFPAFCGLSSTTKTLIPPVFAIFAMQVFLAYQRTTAWPGNPQALCGLSNSAPIIDDITDVITDVSTRLGNQSMQLPITAALKSSPGKAPHLPAASKNAVERVIACIGAWHKFVTDSISVQCVSFFSYLHDEIFSRPRVSLGDAICDRDSKGLHWFKLFH
jgi:hypothetical protein